MTSCFRIPIDYVNFSVSEIINIVVEPENRRIIAGTVELIAAVEKIFYRNGKISLKAVHDQTSPVMSYFAMEPFDPFFEILHDTINRLIEAGVMNALKIHSRHSRKMYDEEVPTLVLSLGDLEIGFLVCLIPLTLSVLAFIIEVAISIFKRFARTVWDISIAVFVLNAFVDFRTIAI